MKLHAVSVGLPREVSYTDRKGRARTVTTGIFKDPADGPVMLRAGGLDGDGQADLDAHGGPDKAAYIYSVENYAYWADTLDRADLKSAAQFGENLTVSGLADTDISIGDRFRIGAALVEVSQPRVPCFKLGILMGDPGFPARFADACRTGFYVRVLEEGAVRAGDGITADRWADDTLTVYEAMQLLYHRPDDIDGARKALAIPALSAAWKQSFRNRIEKTG